MLQSAVMCSNTWLDFRGFPVIPSHNSCIFTSGCCLISVNIWAHFNKLESSAVKTQKELHADIEIQENITLFLSCCYDTIFPYPQRQYFMGDLFHQAVGIYNVDNCIWAKHFKCPLESNRLLKNQNLDIYSR